MLELDIEPASETNGVYRSVIFSFKNPTEHDMRNLRIYYNGNLIGHAPHHFAGANRWGVKMPVTELGITEFPLDKANFVTSEIRRETLFTYEGVLRNV